MPFVDEKNARAGDYQKTIKKILLTNKCPFCKENFKYHKNPILKKKASWFITENSWPYKGTRFHFIILNHLHRVKLSELATKDYQAIISLCQWAINTYKIKGGALTMRFGDTKMTGSSVSHIHAHLIVPKIDRKTKKAVLVNFPIG